MVRVECHAQAHNTMSLARARTLESSAVTMRPQRGLNLTILGGPSESREPTLNKPTSIKDRGPGSIAYIFLNDQYSGQIRMIIRMVIRMVKHDVYLRSGGSEMEQIGQVGVYYISRALFLCFVL